MYKLNSGVNIEYIRKYGEKCSQSGDRLGFAYFTRKYAVINDLERIHPSVVIYDDYVEIKNNLIVKANTVIGGYGFGFERDAAGVPQHLYHYGKVVIGDHVWIGANCTIDRGTVNNTVIKSHTKIDNLVHIAHNCKIGCNVIICAGTVLCGSVTIKDNAWLAPGTLVKEGITIGENAKTGLGAVVVKDVEPNTTVIGIPAKAME